MRDVIAIATVPVGLFNSAVWTGFLAFELVRLVEYFF